MKLIYTGPYPEVLVPVGFGEIVCERGKEAEIPEELAGALLKANPESWERAVKPEKLKGN